MRHFGEDHDAFRDLAHRFLAAEVVPHLDEWRADGRVPGGLFVAAGALGLLGTAAPEELGGAGDLLFTAVLIEETAAVGATGLALTFAIHAGVCLPLVLEHGSEEQRRGWVPGLVSGEVLAATAAIGAPMAAGSDLTIDTTVDGVTAGLDAGLLLLGASGRLLLLPAGVVVERRPVVDSLGARDAGQADLVLRGEVAIDCVVPGEAAPLTQVRQDLDLWAAVLGVAAARSVLRLTLAYVRERRVFGRPLAEFENTRHVLAEVAAGIESAQMFTDAALMRRMAGTLSPAQAAMARIGAAAIHDRAVDQGMQLHGGYGYMREYPISHAFADARYLRVHTAATSNALDTVAAALSL